MLLEHGLLHTYTTMMSTNVWQLQHFQHCHHAFRVCSSDITERLSNINKACKLFNVLSMVCVLGGAKLIYGETLVRAKQMNTSQLCLLSTGRHEYRMVVDHAHCRQSQMMTARAYDVNYYIKY